jgi:ethanolamine utilization protein EutS
MYTTDGSGEKLRVVQESVPGKQVTLAHVIPSPVPQLYERIGLIDGSGALGILTITPSEGAIIASDVASKAAGVKIGFVDRFNGSLIITGLVADVETAIESVMDVLCNRMGYTPTKLTRS